MQELSYEWMLHSRSLMLKRGKLQDFFFPLLGILSLQQAQPSNVSREVKTSLSVFFMWVCERNLSAWSCTGIDTINLNGSFTTVRVFCKHMLSCQPTSFKPGCWAQQMVYPADTHAPNSYFNTQLCCLNEATASWKVLKLPITGNLGEVNCDGRGRLQRGGDRNGHFGGARCTVMSCKHESCHAVPPAKGKPWHGFAAFIEE